MFNDRARVTEGVLQVVEPDAPLKGIRFAFKRCSPQSLYVEMEHWFSTLKINEVISHDQSESNGYVTISLFYR